MVPIIITRKQIYCWCTGLVLSGLVMVPCLHLVATQEGHHVAARASRQFLMACVKQCYGKLCRSETDLFFQKRQLEFVRCWPPATAGPVQRSELCVQSSVHPQG